MEAKEAKAHKLTIQRFGKAIQMYAPLYLSNECIDTCLYCGFSRLNKIVRKTLGVAEVLKEADFLIAQGFQHLLLVAGEHPKKVSVEYLCEIAYLLRKKIASLSIEVAPFEESDYRKLIQSGVDGVVIYQETYNEDVYKKVHAGGPKKDFQKRFEFVEGACRAGVRHIGIGVLLGLTDWREEIPKLIEHARYLMKHYWQTEVRISLPRLRPSAAGFLTPHPVSDDALAEIICHLRIQLPEVGLILSTREPPALRDKLLKLGVTHMSAGSRTEPGGYLNPNVTGKQFELEDLRTPSEVAQAIQREWYEPVWKDWI